MLIICPFFAVYPTCATHWRRYTWAKSSTITTWLRCRGCLSTRWLMSSSACGQPGYRTALSLSFVFLNIRHVFLVVFIAPVGLGWWVGQADFIQQEQSKRISKFQILSRHIYRKPHQIETSCYNVSHTQRPIDNRFEFCKKRKYYLHLNTDPAWKFLRPTIGCF